MSLDWRALPSQPINMLLHDKCSISQLDVHSWERQAFESFSAVVADNNKAFPCTLGVAGLAADQLRFHFIHHDPQSDAAAHQVAAALQAFIPCARNFGKNTSLVVMFRELRDQGVEVYEAIFWRLLDRLHRLDCRPWPKDFPRDPDHPAGSFPSQANRSLSSAIRRPTSCVPAGMLPTSC